MRKAFAVLLTLALLLTAAAFAEDADFLGVWYLTGIISQGEPYKPADFGLSMMMQLNEDGTASVTNSMIAEATESAWVSDGDTIIVTIGDSPARFVLSDSELISVSEDNGMTLVFGREPPEVEEFTPASVVAADEADFAGIWKAFKYGMDGIWSEAVVMGMDMVAEFADGNLQLTGFFGSETPIPMAFVEGAYIHETDDDSEMFSTIKAEMLEDGNIQISMASGEMAFLLIMAPAPAAGEPAA